MNLSPVANQLEQSLVTLKSLYSNAHLVRSWPNNWLQKFIISIESRFLQPASCSYRLVVLLKPKHNSRVCHHAYLSCISSFAILTSLINFTWLSLKEACSLSLSLFPLLVLLGISFQRHNCHFIRILSHYQGYLMPIQLHMYAKVPQKWVKLSLCSKM